MRDLCEGTRPMPRLVTRLAFAVLLGGSMLQLRSVEAAGEPPAVLPALAVTPTIPAPLPPHSYHIRLQHLVPPLEARADVDKEKPLAPVETGPPMALGECIAVALERQPSLKAVQASMAATQAGYKALLKFGTTATILNPDLEIRKQQAQRGLNASAAEYQKAHNEIVQDVTRLYYTAVYAKQAEGVARDLAEQLDQLIILAETLLKEESDPKKLDGLNRQKILAMKIGVREVRQKQAEARIGRQQAMAALRQVMAVDAATFPFTLKDTELPLMAQKVPITMELVVEQALCRRPELALASAGVDAFRLEVYAQGKVPFKRKVPTFASGADIHAKEIPQAVRTLKEYRPGGVALELPPQLVGSKFDRVCRAMAFSQRAEAMFESARSLVKLEAENGYLEFELVTEKLQLQKEKLDLALDVQKSVRENQQNIKDKSVIVQAEVLATQTQAAYLDAVLQHLVALSALERITAGGIQPAFPGR
jgi:outer membrane protein TolC